MSAFLPILSDIFREVLFISITASAIGLVVLLVRITLHKKLSPKWQRVLWVFMLLALLTPLRPESKASLTGLAEPVRQITLREDFTQAQTHYQHIIQERAEAFSATETSRQLERLHYRHIWIDIIIPLVWFSGVMVVAGFTLLGREGLKRHLLKSDKNINLERVKDLLLACAEQTGTTKKFEIIIQDDIKSPALFGTFAPKIILPAYINEMDDQCIKHILLHEIGHYKRHDLIINFAMLIIRALYWFNPLIWSLLTYVGQDIELANDAYILELIGEEQKNKYSYTLIEILRRANKIPFLYKPTCMVDSKADMRRRLCAIKQSGHFKKNRTAALMLTFALVCTLSLAFLTNRSSAETVIGDGLTGNWVLTRNRDSYNHADITEIFTFGLNQTVSVISMNQGVLRRSLNGIYTTDEEAGMLHLTYLRNGTTDISAVDVFLHYSFSKDGQMLTMLEPEYGSISEYTRTAAPSKSQISGTWTGTQADGSALSLTFDLDGIVYIQTQQEHPPAQEFYALNGGQIEIIERNLRTKSSAGILLSSDKNRLLLFDSCNMNNKILELTKQYTH
jgi:beta-lactamase regulating signal transducer with metallopeptidase domain